MRRCFGTHVIGGFFLSALLPPRDDSEPSFYEVLGLDDASRTIDDEQLRKAYRKLSLKFHPDKIAQRGGVDKEAAAAEYERIQEAYHVLIVEKKRLKYDALGTPTRYRFVERGGFADPQSLYENLTASSVHDKSRLVVLFGVAILLVLMQPILIAAKVNQSLQAGGGPLETSSWFAILIPYWVFAGLFIVLTFVVAAFFVASTRDRIPICLTGLEQFFWYLGIIFLCFKWDETWDDSVLYRQTLAPIYVAMILRWSRTFLTLQNVRKDVNRMVTSDYIENELLKGKSMDELSEEEQEDIRKAFLVVSVDPEFVEPPAGELTDEELEGIKVESSPEYESATEIYRTTFNGLSISLLFGIIFLILLTLKLDDRLNSNWWAVFSPFWIERGGRLIVNMCNCCCGGISGEEVVVYAGVDFPTDTEVNNVDNDKESSKDDKIEETSAEDATKTPSSEKETSDGIKTIVSPEINDDNGGEEEKRENTIADSNKEDKNLASTGKSVEKEDKPETTSPADGVGGNGGEGGGDDDDEGIELDEDTYFAFQNAYREAEKDAKNERAQSGSESCVLIFQIILLCLVVAKIDKNFDSADPNDVGFNVFWIIFPFFLFFGLTLCCCAILIFGAAPEQPLRETDPVEYDPENPPINNDNDENQGGVTIIPVNPAEEEETAVEAIVAMEKQVDESTVEKSDPSNAPSDSNMDDLD